MTTAIPTRPEDLGAFLTEDRRMNYMNDADAFLEFLNSYTQGWAKTQAGQAAQADAEALRELEVIALAQRAGADVPRDFNAREVVDQARRQRGMGLRAARLGHGAHYNKAAIGAGVDGHFNSAHEFFTAVIASNRPSWNVENKSQLLAQLSKMQDIQNSYGSTVPSDGGFLIPEVLRSEILQLALERSIVRGLATVIQMDSLRVPIPTVDETSRVTSIFGGVQFFWLAEGQPGVDTSAKFGVVTLDAKKLMGYTGIPNELMHDAPAFMTWFGTRFPQGIGWFEDIAYLGGDGVKQPLGVANGTGLVSVPRTTTNKIIYDDIVKMFQSMYPASLGNACWIAAHDTFQQLAELTFTPSGGTPVPVMLWQPNATAAPTPTILGRPVIFTEKTGPLGSANDLMFVDFSEYLIGDRQMMQVESSADYLFGTDKTAFKVIERVDGRPWLPTPITPHNNSTVLLSPYVGLAH